jgi:hypothetical protein
VRGRSRQFDPPALEIRRFSPQEAAQAIKLLETRISEVEALDPKTLPTGTRESAPLNGKSGAPSFRCSESGRLNIESIMCAGHRGSPSDRCPSPRGYVTRTGATRGVTAVGGR